VANFALTRRSIKNWLQYIGENASPRFLEKIKIVLPEGQKLLDNERRLDTSIIMRNECKRIYQ
jgi:hypothetical protein